MTSEDENIELGQAGEGEHEGSGLIGLSGGLSPDPNINMRDILLQQLHQNIREQLASHTWEIIQYVPIRFLVAHTGYKQIIHASVKNKESIIRDDTGKDTEQYEIIPQLNLHSIIIGAIPTEVTIHENPLGLGDYKYTIKFSTHTNNTFTIGPKNLEEIVSYLREKALVFVSRGASEALSIIIGGFAKDKKIITKIDVETPGFYFVEGTITGYHVDHPRPKQEEIQRCINILDELASRYKRTDVFATLIRWTIVAPFDFCLKQCKGVFIPWLQLYGFSGTGKTSLGDIPLAVWGKYHDKNYKIPYTNIDTVPKFGEVLSKSTYPITVNEVGALSDDKHRPLVEMFKNAIETQTARSKFVRKVSYTEIPSLCACILTSNPQPPSDTGYRRRLISIAFTRDDEHTAEERESFERLISERVSPELHTLGDFVANYILDHQQALILDAKAIHWKSISKTVLEEFYKAAGKETPEWLDYFVEETQMADSKEDSDLILRGFFINIVNDTYSRHQRSIDNTTRDSSSRPQVPNLPFSHRLNFCLTHRLIPFLNRGVINEGQNEGIILTSDLMQEVRKLKLDSYISSLVEISRMIPGFEYGPKKLGKNTVRAAYGSKIEFLEFLNVE